MGSPVSRINGSSPLIRPTVHIFFQTIKTPFKTLKKRKDLLAMFTTTMIENRLILFLRKTKSLTQKISSSNPRKWKTFSTPCELSSEPQARFYSSFPRFIPASKPPATRSLIGYGLRSLLQNNYKVFEFFAPLFSSYCIWYF